MLDQPRMTETKKDKATDRVEGDGRKFITFLAYAAAVIGTTAVFCLTNVFLSPADRLSFSVPDNAVLYVRGEYGSLPPMAVLPQDAQAEIGPVPDGVRPHDMAVFAVPVGDGLLWGAALGWSAYAAPTDEEKRILDAAGWRSIIRNVYVSGRASRIEHPDSVPLSKTRGRMLKAIADLLPIQGYVAPAGIPHEALPVRLSFIKEFDAMVIGLDLASSPSFAMALPMTEATKLPPILGFRMPREAAGGKTLPTLDEAHLTLTGRSTMIDPLNVLFSQVERARLERRALPTEEYLTSADDLRVLLSGPITLSLLTGQDGSVNYVAGFPASSPDALKAKVIHYLSASLPDKKRVPLPDGSYTTEIQINPDKFAFYPLEDAELSGVETVRDDENGFALVLSPDGRGGSYLSTDMNFIKSIAKSSVDGAKGRCREPKDASILHLRMPIYDYAELSLISTKGDNLILACGYHK